MRFLLLLFVLQTTVASSQTKKTETVYLHLDKSFCLAGDTVWFKGYIMEGDLLSQNSTSLFVEMFDRRGYLITSKMFPLITGVSIGQLEIPDNATPGIYYIRAYTKWEGSIAASCLFQVPITVVDITSNNALVLRSVCDKPAINNLQAEIITDTFSAKDKGYNSWRLLIKDTVASLSVSVTDALVDSNKISITNSMSTTAGTPGLGALPDSNYLQFSGYARKLTDRSIIRNRELLMFISTKDSQRVLQILHIDTSGHFLLNNFWLYDTAQIHFQIKDKRWRSKDVELIADHYVRPKLYNPDERYEYGMRTGLQKTSFMDITRIKAGMLLDDKIRMLKPVIVTAKLKPVIEKMNDEYTTGAFRTAIDAKSFDLINDDEPGLNLEQYLTSKMNIQCDNCTSDEGGFTYRGQKLTYFVDEFPSDWSFVRHIPLVEIAFIKVFPPPFVMGMLMQGAVGIYMKKGSELERKDPSMLKDFVVTARRDNKQLEKEYVKGGFFDGYKADYSIDLRNAQKEFDLFEYMKKKFPGFDYEEHTGGGLTFTYHFQSMMVYVNEWSVSPDEMRWYRRRVSYLAYAKIVAQYPVMGGGWMPALVVYERKGDDLRGWDGGLNKMNITGYDRPRLPHMPTNLQDEWADNRITLFWNPLIIDNETDIHFRNNDYTRKFKVTVEGIGLHGERLHYETVIDKNK